MGLFEGTNYEYPYDSHEPENFFPLKKIINDKNDLLFEDCCRVFEKSGATRNYIQRLAESFSELADNIYFHSGEEENCGWGYIHAQAYENKICLGICDVGIGIYESYKRTGQLKGRSEDKLIIDIFEESESSLNNSKKNHRGLGLYEVKGFIDMHGGSLKMLSGNASVKLEKNKIDPKKIFYKTEGSWIEMVVPVR